MCTFPRNALYPFFTKDTFSFEGLAEKSSAFLIFILDHCLYKKEYPQYLRKVVFWLKDSFDD